MSDVFAGMQVRSFGYARLTAQAPWGFTYTRHDASLGMVAEGECWLSMTRLPQPVHLHAGDCFLIVHGDEHVLSDRPDSPTRPFSEILETQGRAAHIEGRGANSTVVGGWFRFDPLSSRPMRKVLPPLIHIEASRSRKLGLDSTLRSLAAETRLAAPGAEIVINRLAEILFIQMIRAHVSSEMSPSAGWLGALSDRQIGAALKLMHERTIEPWTVDKLAGAVGLSRSAFAHRFRELVGEPPLEYLTNWRMLKACRLLRGGDMKLGLIASTVGYQSQVTFCNAFKRTMGTTASHYRAGVK